MLKFSVFTLGLGSGVFLGIHLREQGFTSNMTRAYYAYKNEDGGSKKKVDMKKPDIDDLYDYFNKGLIDESRFSKFKDIVYSKRYDNIDQVVVQDANKMMNDPSMRSVKAEKNAFYNK